MPLSAAGAPVIPALFLRSRRESHRIRVGTESGRGCLSKRLACKAAGLASQPAKGWSFGSPTLTQTWTRDRYHVSAMRVQSVDIRMSCSSHYVSELAPFFIDPRAK